MQSVYKYIKDAIENSEESCVLCSIGHNQCQKGTGKARLTNRRKTFSKLDFVSNTLGLLIPKGVGLKL